MPIRCTQNICGHALYNSLLLIRVLVGIGTRGQLSSVICGVADCILQVGNVNINSIAMRIIYDRRLHSSANQHPNHPGSDAGDYYNAADALDADYCNGYAEETHPGTQQLC